MKTVADLRPSHMGQQQYATQDARGIQHLMGKHVPHRSTARP